MTDKEIRPFGTWPSQISAEMLSAGIRLNDVQWARGSDTLVWSQSYEGQTTLFAKPKDALPYPLTDENNKPSGGIAYGGGEFLPRKMASSSPTATVAYTAKATRMAHPPRSSPPQALGAPRRQFSRTTKTSLSTRIAMMALTALPPHALMAKPGLSSCRKARTFISTPPA